MKYPFYMFTPLLSGGYDSQAGGEYPPKNLYQKQWNRFRLLYRRVTGFILPMVLIAIFLFYTGVFDGSKLEKGGDQPAGQESGTVLRQRETKSDDQPPIAVRVTPMELGKDAKMWKFEISFDTHAGSLDQDPLKSLILFDDKGNTYSPVSWEGPGAGGHHRQGMLIFNPIRPAPPYVELMVKDVGGIPERAFKWEIK